MDWRELGDPVVAPATSDRLRRSVSWPRHREVLDALGDLVVAVRSGDPTAIEPAVVVLEVDPMFFASGYAKEKLMRALAQVPIEPDHATRLRAVVLRRCRARWPRHELRALRSLARAVATPDLVAELRALPPGPDRDRPAEEAFIAAVAAAAILTHTRVRVGDGGQGGEPLWIACAPLLPCHRGVVAWAGWTIRAAGGR